MKRLLSIRTILLLLFATVIGLLLFVVSPTQWEIIAWSPNRVKESEQKGNELIAAIEAYRSDNGRYPPGLSDLIPGYIQSVSPPTAGTRRWDYRAHDDGKRFVLKFEMNGGYPCSYFDSQHEAWYEDR
jgi:hypothetical protein